MTERVAFDTNAVIYFVEGVEPYRTWLSPMFASVQSGDRAAVLSAVTEAEALVKPLRDGNSESIGRMTSFFQPPVEVIDVSREIARTAGRVRAQLELSLPDAIIVATAMTSGCDALVGNDSRCAARVRGMRYIYLDDAVKEL